MTASSYAAPFAPDTLALELVLFPVSRRATTTALTYTLSPDVTLTLGGNFVNDAGGNPLSGSVQSLTYKQGTTTIWSMSGMSLSLAQLLTQAAGGDPATLLASADAINGSSSSDLLHGYAGNDVLNGNAGANRLYGDAGHDQMLGGSGADTLIGGEGDDTLDGGTDTDTDHLLGGSDDDTYWTIPIGCAEQTIRSSKAPAPAPIWSILTSLAIR